MIRKLYQVIFTDEYENLYEVGWYEHLADAIPDINDHLTVYTNQEGEPFKIDNLQEYASTFGWCFDVELIMLCDDIDDDPYGLGCCMVRGFVKCFDLDDHEYEILKKALGVSK